MENSTVKSKKPMTPAQEAKYQKQRNAIEKIKKLTKNIIKDGYTPKGADAAHWVKLESLGENTSTFLNKIREDARKKAAKEEAAAARAEARTLKVAKKQTTAKTNSATKASRKKKNKTTAAAASTNMLGFNTFPITVAAAASASKESLNLTNDDLKILQQCERVHEKILEKAKLNLKNVLGKNANASNARALANVRKSGATLSAKNYLKIANTRKQQAMTRKGRPPMALENIAPKKTAAAKKALEEFLEKNA